jgi:cytochrome c551/c552
VVISQHIALVSLLGLLACSGENKAAVAADSGVASLPGTQGGAPASSDPRAAIFLSKGCPQCHSISALGVKSPAEVGPDLTLAYEDVQSRFSMPLEQFLHNPTGTMQLVLSSQIQLSTAERDSIIHILKKLNEDRKEAGEDHD